MIEERRRAVMADAGESLRDELRVAWRRYVDLIAPYRPALHGYCRRLAGNVWDAEDLVQDTLIGGFGQLGLLNREVRNTRAYLLRVATNLWIDEVRRRDVRAAEPLGDVAAAGTPSPSRATEVREAGERLVQRLSPQERAALLLKEVFEMSLDEIADVLSTTPGAVKAALHHGRARLRESADVAASRRPLPSKALVDRFIALYDARDATGLAALMLETGSVENVGEAVQRGAESFSANERNILRGLLHGHAEDWPGDLDWSSQRVERRELDGEPIGCLFIRFRGADHLMAAMRFEEVEGRVSRLRIYGFCPETMREVAERLGVPVLTGIYRPPTPIDKGDST
jgi:RNA polymerase sigma-70 factor (ECF subfamily)